MLAVQLGCYSFRFCTVSSQWIELLHIFSQKSVNDQWPIAGEVMIIDKSNIILLNNEGD